MNTETTIISKGTELKGTLTAAGDVVIRGTFEGEIRTDADVKVTKEGALDSSLSCRDMTVDGTVQGEAVCSDTLTVSPGESYSGRISAKNLVTQPGSEINTEIEMKR